MERLISVRLDQSEMQQAAVEYLDKHHAELVGLDVVRIVSVLGSVEIYLKEGEST